ncbi:M16 family metallopeptidase [Aporhodopirellula aestuarii]|uniref:Insulinase family protein n=1 Tax=Aporhodopirellula aestuarii TaxID=2950107 RepID=A0ABT0U0L1_9BACT|nr:pitrilysin family protein [Aporhodopirellula aestuarii]MCM2370179.1 insulinase family protein [Aporhodopirellula aestuarii]
MLSIETPPVQTRRLTNGMTVVWQPMPWLRTASYTMWMPGGISAEIMGLSSDVDPVSRCGLASLTVEMVQRGAGPYSSRQFVAAEDNLGIDSNGSSSTSITGFSAAMPAGSLAPAIGLLADLVRRPHLPIDQFEDAKMMLRQEMLANQDEPTQRLIRRLRERQYGMALGRSGVASPLSLESLTMEDVRNFYTEHYHAGQSILAIAGNFDESQINDAIDAAFGDWKSGTWDGLPTPDPIDGHEHIELPSSQTHIGFSYDNIPYGHPEYFVMRAGIGILSDGMSSRLFDRVREKHGLCYSVWANTHSVPASTDREGNRIPAVGAVFGYAGTTPQRAQQTLDLTLHEIKHLCDDLEESELERWKVRIQSSLIMEQESANSRAGSIASDMFQIGRVMPTEELEQIIESITLDQIKDYFQSHTPESFRIVTIGPEPLAGGSVFDDSANNVEGSNHE